MVVPSFETFVKTPQKVFNSSQMDYREQLIYMKRISTKVYWLILPAKKVLELGVILWW